jgi:hypothetical protein
MIVYDRHGWPRLVVEVMASRKTWPQWAAEVRRTLLTLGGITPEPYYLLASSDAFYLWLPGRTDAEQLPDMQVEAGSVLAPYLRHVGMDLEEISGTGLEMLVSSWLHALVYGSFPEETAVSPSWVEESGLRQAIQGGRIATQAPA